MDVEARKKIATQFLKLLMAGNVETAYKRYVDMKGKHHNPFVPAGFPSLRKAMTDANAKFPNAKLKVNRVIGDKELVAVHSHLTMKKGNMEFSAVHIFRFNGNKIVEFWDIAGQLPAKSPNKDGAF